MRLPRHALAYSARRRLKAWGRPVDSSCRCRTKRAPVYEPFRVRLKTLPNRETAILALAGLFTSFSVTQPQLYVDIDVEKAKSQGINLKDLDATLQAYLGSFYVNDFFFQNRNWQVNLQAAPRYRMKIDDIGNLEVRNGKGNRVPLRTLINVKYDSGPAIVNHYNLFPSAEINGGTAPGVSSGQAISIIDGVAETALPDTMGFEWTELTLQQIIASKDLLTKLAFPLAVVFVFLGPGRTI